MGSWLEYLVAKKRALTWGILGFMALLVILDLLIPTGYGRFPWDGIGGFGALYGFVSCVLIIVVSKALGYALLYRPEDYYQEDYYGEERIPVDPPEPVTYNHQDGQQQAGRHQDSSRQESVRQETLNREGEYSETRNQGFQYEEGLHQDGLHQERQHDDSHPQKGQPK